MGWTKSYSRAWSISKTSKWIGHGRYGDTAILSAVTASKEPKELDFFPLTVSYEERLYAVGKIPGGFIKREGRPSEKAVLASRLIDRPIRPLFAEGFVMKSKLLVS